MSQSHNYPVGFYFELSFNGEDVAFKEVSGISKELRVEEEVSSGGENRYKYRLPTISSSKNLVLKRAMAPNDSRLLSWCEDTINGGLSKPIETHEVSVNLMNADGSVLMTWIFHNAYPVKYAIADLKSKDSTLAIHSIELAYTFFEISKDNSAENLFE